MLDQVLEQLGPDHTARLNDFKLYADYRDGRHRYDFASQKYRDTFHWLLRAAQENLCPTIIDVFADKIKADDWGIPNDHPTSPATLDRLCALITHEAYTTGSAFAIVWNDPETGLPVPAFQPASQCLPVVDPDRPDRLAALGKVWATRDGRTRLNIYTPDTLERWVTTDKTAGIPTSPNMWRRYRDNTAPDIEPHGFGIVPACWFKRNATHPTDWGTSILRDAIPIQDELNKIAADTLAASERVALPIRYIMDVAPEMLTPKLNPQTGRLEPPKLPFDEAANNILALTAKGPAGQFPAPDAASLIKLQQHAEDKIARVTGIPVFYLKQSSGDAPSGESLRVVSSRLVSGVSAFTRDNTPVWNGLLELIGVESPSITWTDPMPISTTDQLANASVGRDLGLPVDVWLALGGLDPDAIDETGMRLADRVAAAQTVRTKDAVAALYAGELAGYEDRLP